MSPRAVVIGGGLAGITAAIALAEAGAQVTLLEARPRLGGATCSFSRDGLTVDTGQHVFLGCCSAYRGLLGQLGMTAHAPLQDRFDVTVLASRSASSGGDLLPPAGGSAGPRSPAPCICCPPWPGIRSCLGPNGPWYPAPPWPCASSTRPTRRLDAQRFGDWLAARGQNNRARRALWDLFTVSALNIAGDDASLALAATVVKTGLLGKNNAADIGVPALPLGELHGDAAATLLAKLGAQVPWAPRSPPSRSPRPSPVPAPASRASPLPCPPARPSRRPRLPAEIPADAVVLAVPHEKAAPPDPAGRAARRHGARLGRPGRLADRQRARDLRPAGDRPAVRRRHRLPGAVGLRPHPHLRHGPSRAVPGHLAVGGG